ncbi:MAG: transporter [Rhodothalassiaceae bacterium]|nr:MAG: transporter [Rhodothalassiaceae bacterium]
MEEVARSMTALLPELGRGVVLAVFAAVYVGMALGRWPGLKVDRSAIALIGAVLVVVFGGLPAERLTAAIDWDTLVVLFGLMLVSAQFALSGAWDALAFRIAYLKLSEPALLAVMMTAVAVLSAVLLNDVVAYVVPPVLIAAMARRGLDPRPFLIGLMMAANIGSAASPIGNPQNILLASAGDLGFAAFLEANALPAALALAIAWIVIVQAWRGRWRAQTPVAGGREAAFHRRHAAKGLVALVLLLLALASPLPRPAAVMLAAAFVLISRDIASRELFALVDWPLLILFASLFLVTDAFAALPVARGLAAAIAEHPAGAGGGAGLAALLVVGSNTVGNVPLVTLLLALIPPPSADWLTTVALYATLAGNLLVTGSIANIIVIERAKAAGVVIGWGMHARVGVPATLVALAVAVVIAAVR